ncbi:Cruciform DNA binding protein [Friedmanniomyces endolithicus]|uniref:Cruciform DNA binding protein n=1 Tax=Friedmanniomyces endolithicus TaxID=329885 RepID=A0A4U0UVD3_9PEZI|nr:Cruciform DNA binding protein [Friedmanniomyces endolithicus]KAK0346000.1 Cruciform DNA binding protein [Friedmanniomyces endolithicus]KAK0785625.1 Cruciform DNA binding protein [Friedmanniomyces endolithicus]KAK0797843.1 Cruciform DNA binding protein [Friedmanniomyces endolithicus]KAK0809054.1 Cruciform DNA binding protein [Friedmanniomyces endolithicus]
MDASGLSEIRRRPTLETTPSNPHVNADLDPSIPVEPHSADPKPPTGEQSKQLPLLQTQISRETHPDPALSSPLDPITPANLHSPPAQVLKSQWEANVDPGASADSRAIQEKNEVENELHSKVPESPATSESPTGKRSFMDMLGFTRS